MGWVYFQNKVFVTVIIFNSSLGSSIKDVRIKLGKVDPSLPLSCFCYHPSPPPSADVHNDSWSRSSIRRIWAMALRVVTVSATNMYPVYKLKIFSSFSITFGGHWSSYIWVCKFANNSHQRSFCHLMSSTLCLVTHGGRMCCMHLSLPSVQLAIAELS